jgi:catechol 2,3-dioxygenase-like lactoylglutathione lyase family enzyme
MNTYPGTFSHIGISVPDVEKAVEFYSKVMGWYQIMEPLSLQKNLKHR